jgi:hypothetical protein
VRFALKVIFAGAGDIHPGTDRRIYSQVLVDLLQGF